MREEVASVRVHSRRKANARQEPHHDELRTESVGAPPSGLRVLLAVAFVVVASTVAGADTLKIDRAEPPKSFRFARGAEPMELAVTIRCDIDGEQGGEIAFAVHDQQGRPLMMSWAIERRTRSS